MTLPPAILLMGPTASGKTTLALELAARFPVEIVSVDSAQVFRDMDIGTAKPDRETLARFPHHLIDIVSPEESYSAARFREDALRAMADIAARGRVPLLVGGTLLYFKALREGLADLPRADAELRAAIDAEARAHGWPALHAELARLDPESAGRIAPTDGQRIQRALEVVRLTGEPQGAFFARQAGTPPPYRLLSLALMPSSRSVLHERIAQRFDAMLAAGLVAEVEALRASYRLDIGLPSMRCVGYRQVWEMLEGRLPRPELRDRGVFATRQFAKRQLTWLNGWLKIPGNIDVYDCLNQASQAKIAKSIEKHIASRHSTPWSKTT
jgi:tRNA dimethylallyltransferase